MAIEIKKFDGNNFTLPVYRIEPNGVNFNLHIDPQILCHSFSIDDNNKQAFERRNVYVRNLVSGVKQNNVRVPIDTMEIRPNDVIVAYMTTTGQNVITYDCQRIGFGVRKVGGSTAITTDQPIPDKNCLFTEYKETDAYSKLWFGGSYVDEFIWNYNGGTLTDDVIRLALYRTTTVNLPAGRYKLSMYPDYPFDKDVDLSVYIEYTSTLETPTLSVDYNEMNGTALIRWDSIEGATKYLVKRDGVLLQSTPLLEFVIDRIGTYEIIATNDSNEYLLDSEPAVITIQKQWELSQPIISLENDIISWSAVDKAVGYKVLKDLRDVTPNGIITDTSFQVVGYGSYKVQAVANPNSLFEDSQYSNPVEYEKLQIIFYQNSAESNRLDKTEYLVERFNLNGVLRSATSITNPVIQIDMFEYPSCNYCYIPAFNRYYYIDDIVSVRTRLWELSMTVDPLMSFKDKVLDTWALVSRNENDYNLFINDPLIPVTTQPNIETKRLATGIFSTSTVDGVKARCFVMTFAGYTDSDNRVANGPYLGSSVNATYFLNIDELREVLSKVYNRDFWSNVGNLFGGDPTEGIISIKEYPLNFDDLLDDDDYEDVTEIEVPFGTDLSEIHARKLIKNRLFRAIVDDLNTGTVRGMEDLPPFCNYQMYIPFYGFIDLPPSFIGTDFKIIWNISLRDGSVFIELQRSGEQVECVLEGSIGMDIPISRSGATERLSAYANTAMKIVGGAVSGGAGLGAMYAGLSEKVSEGTASNYVASAQFGSALVSTGIDTFTSGLSSAISVKHTFPSVNIGQTYSSFFLESVITLVISRPTTVLINRTNQKYRHLLGLPKNSFSQLKDLSGYTICTTYHLEGFNDAFPMEIDGISTALKTGILLPRSN